MRSLEQNALESRKGRCAVQFPTMKRFRSWLINLLAGMSLSLFLVAVALCYRSYSEAENFIFFGQSGAYAAHDAKGRLVFVFENLMVSNPHFECSSLKGRPKYDYADPYAGPHTPWNRLGFYFARSSRESSSPLYYPLPAGISYPSISHFIEFVIPFWFLFVLLALLPLWNFVLPLFHRFHRLPGNCPKCGYDLRATPDRCPECGTIAANP
jgi:hypothetical protein